ncbi:DUF3179 domain-containing protein [Methylibium sp.]|uniref:DUF3179 domain-containing protein n=1 Tax=Methylibium sp. TaxID=2067992 RepID=UPI003D0A5F89
MIRIRALQFTLMCSVLLATVASLAATEPDGSAPPKQTARPAATRQAQLPLGVFTAVIGDDEKEALAALARIEQSWHESSAAMLIEMIHFAPSRRVLHALIALIEKKSGRSFDGDINAWYEWLWSAERAVHPDYAEFKAWLYEAIDPRFREYFQRRPKSIIRLDEIRWGGVRRDGIPPLKNPAMITAGEAGWLQDSDVIFGVAVNGDVRAYPKRILAWHEMFKDRIGGRELAGVYCTLCGALVLYDTTVDGVQHELGTSGFLYRSNKLMYDHATKSLWSTLTGTPVVGPLVGKGIELKPLYVVTTTWKEWRTRHPGTQVLSLETGHRRDYSEGAAYREYFATDQLMFTVPKHDERLPNKAEVLALRLPQAQREALAIAADFLVTHPVYHTRMSSVNMVVFTDASGANRVYESRETTFTSWDNMASARDSLGNAWRVDESQLTAPNGQTLKRLPAHRAFWFGWHAAFPETRLVK